MKKIILSCILISSMPILHAQNKSDFETINEGDDKEVIYKGPCTFEDIGQVKAFSLVESAAAYKPDVTKIETLSEQLKQYRLIIFLGTWCEDSHHLIPQLYRVLEDTNYPLTALQLYALDRDKKGKNEEEKQYNITNVPTIILVRDGREKGRITETVHKDIESDLLEIIQQR